MSDTTTPAPTEEQIKTANEAEQAKWQGDFNEEDLKVEYKKEEPKADDDKDEPGTAPVVDDDTTDDSEDPDDLEDTVEYTDPSPVITTEDPGEYTPADYSFEVTLANGKSVTVKSPEDADKIAEDPENFDKPKELLDFISKATSMKNKLERDEEKHKEQKAKFDEQSQEAQARDETISTFASEFKYLEDKGQLPKVAKEYRDADWTDPQVAKQPGVKEQLELLDYMVKENTTRAKAGVKPITSIVDAYNAWMLDNNRVSAKQAEKQAGEARKAAGAKVAGVSPSAQAPYVPKGIAVGNPNILKRGQAQWDD